MKKILKKITAALFVLTAAVMCTAIGFTAYAENADKVADGADLLTDSQEKALENTIMDVIEKHGYGYDIVVVTTNSTGGKSPMEYADDYYDYNDYGYDSRGSGILFLVDMGGRNWYISTKGKGIDAFTDYGIDRIGDTVAVYLTDGDYSGGFDRFVSLADEYIEKYETSGSAYDVGEKPRNYGQMFLVAAVIGLIAALVVCLIMKGQLHTAVKQYAAQSYIKGGRANVTRAGDIFLYKNVSRVKIESDSGGGHGGSSTHHSSSGSSHGGGGGHF